MAWAEFHDLYAPIIAGFARRMGARSQEVDDLVQEVLKAFFCVSPEFKYNPATGRFRGYHKTCVWSKLAAQRRKRGPDLRSTDGRDAFDLDEVAVESV